jgi:hypothetical protein
LEVLSEELLGDGGNGNYTGVAGASAMFRQLKRSK